MRKAVIWFSFFLCGFPPGLAQVAPQQPINCVMVKEPPPQADINSIEERIKVGTLALAAFGLVLTGVGLVLNYRQARIAQIGRRAQFITDMFYSYLQDADATEVFLKLQFGSFEYPENFHHSKMEISTGRLLNSFNRIVMLSEIGAVNKKDLKYLNHEFWVLSRNEALQKYFEHLDSLQKENKLSSSYTFTELRKVAKHFGTSESHSDPNR
jgi:hypothetical protein